jgi:6-phosphogluconolactonase
MIRPLIALTCAMFAATAFAQDAQLVYFGTYTNPESGSEGVYVSHFSAVTGELSSPVVAAKTVSPSFLALHPSGKFLYTVGEEPAEGSSKSVIGAYKILRPSGILKPLNSVDSGGDGPCHISLEKDGTLAMTAQYSGGTVTSYPVGKDGKLAGAVSNILHEGNGPVEERQETPHAHCIKPSPDNRFALACDLGADKVFIYKIDPAAGTLTAHGEARLPGAAGPRHLAFHPNGLFVFVNGEISMTAHTFAWDAEKGTLKLVDTVSTLPQADRALEGLSTAEIVVHPNGRFVYVSNRTHDTIAVLGCDASTGKLTLIENVPAEGKIPRNFSLDLTGKWMIVAHQETNSAAVFSVNPETGRLRFTGKKVSLGAPVCVRFLASE